MKFSKQELRSQCERIGKEIRNFLHSPQCREFLFFLFFVFVAFTFWILQTLNETYETEVHIPLRIKNVPNDVVMTNELPQQIVLTIQDKGTVLANYKWGQGLLPLVLDFEDCRQRGPHVRIPTADLQKKMAGQLAVSTNLLDISPDTLELIYTQSSGKKVPVKMAGEVLPGRQYYIAECSLKPDTVMVYAPQQMLDTLTGVNTEKFRFANVSDTLHRLVALQPVKGVKCVPDKIVLDVTADMLTEKKVSVPIVGIGFPADKQLKTFPSHVDVSFLVGLQQFKKITADDFLIEVSYEDLTTVPTPTKCRLELKRMPLGVNHVRLHPESVDYLIEQVN